MPADSGAWLALALLAPYPFCLLYAMATDLHRFEIPNRIPLAMVGAYLLAGVSLGSEPLIILRQCGIGAAFLLVGALLFARGAVGGGDVKLLAACVPWLAPGALPFFLFWMSVFGGILALSILALRRAPLPRWLGRSAWLQRFRDANKLPYGLAIGCAGLLTLPRLSLLGD